MHTQRPRGGLELQAELVSCLWWVLGTCIRASAGAARAHTCCRAYQDDSFKRRGTFAPWPPVLSLAYLCSSLPETSLSSSVPNLASHRGPSCPRNTLKLGIPLLLPFERPILLSWLSSRVKTTWWQFRTTYKEPTAPLPAWRY